VEVGAIKSLSRSLAMELHEWWVRKIRDELLVTYRIGPEDLELLRLERAGESTKDIARRGNMTTAAVDSRFQRLNAKLGTPNRKATARLAAEYGLI
jgi:DNA-binding NarL/FixJ family response regulator